jgi:hypothetical protein
MNSPPPICCTGTPVRIEDGLYQYKCGHVYRVVVTLNEEQALPPKKQPAAVKVKEAVA